MRYPVLIDGEAGAYGVVFPDLPGCTAMGGAIDEALVSAAGAAREWMAVVEADGGTVPLARTLDAVRRDPDTVEALAEGASLASVYVVRTGGAPVKANLSLDGGVLAAIDSAAKRTGRTRSAMVETLAQIALPQLG